MHEAGCTKCLTWPLFLQIYRVQNIRIALVRVDTLLDETIVRRGMNASIGLKNFEAYIKNKYAKDKGKHFDNVQLIT